LLLIYYLVNKATTSKAIFLFQT